RKEATQPIQRRVEPNEVVRQQDSSQPKKKVSEEGIELPETGIEKGKIEEEEESEVAAINQYYSLVPRTPKEDEDIYAYAHIFWNSNKGSLVYKVIEPSLSGKDRKLMKRIKETLEERLDVDLNRLGEIKASRRLKEKTEEILLSMGANLSDVRKKAMKYYLERDFLGLGKIDPLMKDPNIEDISCDGTGIPIYVWHRNPEFGSMETNIKFDDGEALDSFVRRLAQRAEKSISVAKPMVDAALPDGSRLQATLGTDIARHGSNFTIRKFTENPLTPVDLIEFGTIDPRTLAYIWMAVEHQKSVLISGGTATGKTTMLNVVSLFIRPQMKIVTIEDTPELRLPHEHWIPEVSREPISSKGGQERGEVDMYKLLKESLRQRPDYIIVGEVRGKEAFVLFQQMATGHPGLSTIHSDNLERLVDRLTTQPIGLPPSLIENLDMIVFLNKIRHRGSYVRRVKELLEMEKYDRKQDIPIVNKLFSWNPKNDNIDTEGKSIILKEIAEERAVSPEELKKDLEDRTKVLRWMVQNSIRNLNSIGKIIGMYYHNKENLMERVEEMV
ncbi:MAG: type II/IV secretion system ATPase subunit, partial [Candidatus Aenigmatarchaeota archaeon]